MDYELKKSLKNYLETQDILSDKEIDYALTFFTPTKLQKNDYFLKSNQICNKVAFIVKGGIRGYTLDPSGLENIICFKFENQFITSYDSYRSQNHSKKEIQAIEDCILLVIERTELDKLFDEIPACNFILKLLIEEELIDKENHLILNCNSSKDKYLKFLENFPEITRRVKVAHLASYLGMTLRSLTRAKKEALKMV